MTLVCGFEMSLRAQNSDALLCAPAWLFLLLSHGTRSCICCRSDTALRPAPAGEVGALAAGLALTSIVLPSAVTEMPFLAADALVLAGTVEAPPAPNDDVAATAATAPEPAGVM